MKPDLVVDIGNTRIKWGLCSHASMDSAATSLILDQAALPPGDRLAWKRQLDTWLLTGPQSWVVSGVHPERRRQLTDWLDERRDAYLLLDSACQMPLQIHVDQPDQVGMDRLLNAVAANRRRRPGRGAVLVDAGSAVTVDWLDENGAFAGGAILPGLRLMAKALHDYTAQLPLIAFQEREPAYPGKNTAAAMEAGIFWTVVGGIRGFAETAQALSSQNQLDVFLTGGDGSRFHQALCRWAEESNFHLAIHLWPEMTLEGIRLAAEALP